MGDAADYIFDREQDVWDAHLLGMCGEYGICQYCESKENTVQGKIDQAQPSKSGKSLQVQIGGNWYTTGS